ncbi:MAG: HDIG domain-containing protein [Deltaproteobacteria bacterium]|jgi:putative nucleotidyltransferase with HDIG domain|nr:HDIG domain-containing protein [Deltaproteobacteria bacterium]
MTQKKTLPDLPGGPLQKAAAFLRRGRESSGFLAFLGLLALVSFTVTFEWRQDQRPYVQGEVAVADIMADHAFSVQDPVATKARREAVEKAQPLICILNTEPVDAMHTRIKDWFLEAKRAEGDPGALESLRLTVSDALGDELSVRLFSLMADQNFQTLLGNVMLPWAEARLRAGVVPDARKLAGYSGGVIVRDLKTGQETLFQDSLSIPDIKDFLLDLEWEARSQPAGVQAKRLIPLLLGNLAEPTLTLNEEDTRRRAAAAAEAVAPVVQRVERGEIIVRQGERIDAEQVVKLNALWGRDEDRFKPLLFLGTFGLAVLICLGMFFPPPGRRFSPERQKDMLFIGFLAFFTVLLANAFSFVGLALGAYHTAFAGGSQVFAVPVAGAIGLSCLTLGDRHKYAVAMLFSFFCAGAGNGGIALFLFYFMSGLFCTWLILDCRSRKEVVWALLPLSGGFLSLWLMYSFLQGGVERFPAELLPLFMGAFLSVIVIFALAPLGEFFFGFTTRFVLMELLNQEHPLLRQLMLEAPGTFHHSVIVANMVESAAKAIGAHSLLAKVGALYHDIGKTDKAEYFIENQFQGDNPHDRLTPAMSALVLISHVKRGAELSQQYKLGSEVTDIIVQHHGNSLVRYFYHKASLLDPGVREIDFSYAGPRPQSREAALVMLADAVEASSRTLADPTPSRIKMHVRNIIRGMLAEGQLDSAELNFRELDLVTENFVLLLTGIFHKRIEYPGKLSPKPGLDIPPAPEPAGDPEKDYHAAQWIVREKDASRRAPSSAGGKKPSAPAGHAAEPARRKASAPFVRALAPSPRGTPARLRRRGSPPGGVIRRMEPDAD